jgi:hypothetical protein
MTTVSWRGASLARNLVDPQGRIPAMIDPAVRQAIRINWVTELGCLP